MILAYLLAVLTPLPAPITPPVPVTPKHEINQSYVIVPQAPPTSEQTDQAPPSLGLNYIWIRGHWRWDNRWVWETGHWQEKPHPAAVWMPGHWKQKPGYGWLWVDGHWE